MCHSADKSEGCCGESMGPILNVFFEGMQLHFNGHCQKVRRSCSFLPISMILDWRGLVDHCAPGGLLGVGSERSG